MSTNINLENLTTEQLEQELKKRQQEQEYKKYVNLQTAEIKTYIEKLKNSLLYQTLESVVNLQLNIVTQNNLNQIKVSYLDHTSENANLCECFINLSEYEIQNQLEIIMHSHYQYHIDKILETLGYANSTITWSYDNVKNTGTLQTAILWSEPSSHKYTENIDINGIIVNREYRYEINDPYGDSDIDKSIYLEVTCPINITIKELTEKLTALLKLRKIEINNLKQLDYITLHDEE